MQLWSVMDEIYKCLSSKEAKKHLYKIFKNIITLVHL